MDAKAKTKQYFDEIAAVYDQSGDGRFVEPMYEALLREIEKTVESGKLLDVGCGNGSLFRFLSNAQYELFGVDFSEKMIAEAKKNCGRKATFSVADAEALPFEDNTFDVVVCNASFHHYVHPNTVLAEMRRVLKDGGRLLIGDPYLPPVARPLMNVLTRYSDKGDYHFYGVAEMKSLLEKNGLKRFASVKTGRHTVLHIAEKERAADSSPRNRETGHDHTTMEAAG